MTSSQRLLEITSEAQARLQVIYAQVRRSFAENLATIEAATGHLEAGDLEEQDRMAAEHAAHRLVGAAETVGFPEATAPARRLEAAFADDLRADEAELLKVDAAALRSILFADDVPAPEAPESGRPSRARGAGKRGAGRGRGAQSPARTSQQGKRPGRS